MELQKIFLKLGEEFDFWAPPTVLELLCNIFLLCSQTLKSVMNTCTPYLFQIWIPFVKGGNLHCFRQFIFFKKISSSCVTIEREHEKLSMFPRSSWYCFQKHILTAIDRVNPITPCFVAQYTGWNAAGMSPLK